MKSMTGVEGPKNGRATVYYGGDIITVNDAQPEAEALAVRGGRILAVGPLEDVKAAAGSRADLVNLEGRTLIPGLIDSHGHLYFTADKIDYANLSWPPIGPVAGIEDLQRELRSYKKEKNLKPGDWIIGMGYDPSHMKEGRQPTRDDLDQVSTEHPVLAIHFSVGHMLAVNSRVLEMAGITGDTPDPPGGHIQRRPESTEPNGVLEELACLPVREMVPPRSFDERMALLGKAADRYVSRGYTTIQDGAIFNREAFDEMVAAAAQGRFKVDVIGYPFYPLSPELMSHFDASGAYVNHFRVGGAKVVLDGGLPGYTAYLREPYHKPLPGMAADYRGYPFYEDQALIDGWVEEFYKNGWPHHIHGLGDGAIEQFLEAVEKAQKTYPDKSLRPTLIHAIVMGEDQLDRARDLGVVPSFFSAHNYLFSDFHVSDTVGPERGFRINPAADAVKRGMKFTIHHDSPVTPADQIALMWAAVNRVGESGRVNGPDQRISPLEALKAGTIHAAYQYFEENIKGSLEVGKLADLVVLSANPLKVDPMAILDIEVLATIKEGKVVFEKD